MEENKNSQTLFVRQLDVKFLIYFVYKIKYCMNSYKYVESRYDYNLASS